MRKPSKRPPLTVARVVWRAVRDASMPELARELREGDVRSLETILDHVESFSSVSRAAFRGEILSTIQEHLIEGDISTKSLLSDLWKTDRRIAIQAALRLCRYFISDEFETACLRRIAERIDRTYDETSDDHADDMSFVEAERDQALVRGLKSTRLSFEMGAEAISSVYFARMMVSLCEMRLLPVEGVCGDAAVAFQRSLDDDLDHRLRFLAFLYPGLGDPRPELHRICADSVLSSIQGKPRAIDAFDDG